jgi:hypothetical protein
MVKVEEMILLQTDYTIKNLLHDGRRKLDRSSFLVPVLFMDLGFLHIHFLLNKAQKV